MMRKLARVAVAALAWAQAAPALAHDWLAECTIGFDDLFALTWNYAQARTTFAMHTGVSPSGSTQVCDATNLACWTYRERCGVRGYVNVEETPTGFYDHIHLMFEDESLTCFADPGDGLGAGYGRLSGGTCVAADWKTEPRFAAGHVPDHTIRIWVEDRVTHAPRNFDVASIRVRGPSHARISFRKPDGSWWYWENLPPGLWNLSGWAWDISELRVRAVDGSPTSVSIDDVTIRN